MRRSWILAIGSASILTAALGAVRLHRLHIATREPAVEAAPVSLVHAEPVPPAREASPHETEDAPLAGLDLLRISSDAGGMVAPAEGGMAHLTLDADLQREALGLMAMRHLPEAAVVMMDVASGRVLVYANHVEHGPPRDLCAEATAPSASVFKIVTAAALIEDAHLDADTKQCYSGGEQRIGSADLVDDPQRDRWCATLAGALGRSINTVFARLAKEKLAPAQLETMARRFGYGQSLAFDVPVQASSLRVPTEPLEFARTAAGFWNTTLSPLEAAELSAIVARGGETVRPSIVTTVASASGLTVWSAQDSPATHRAVTRETADQLTAMMSRTVSEGTSFRAFHDGRGGTFLPGVGVAGKTGTLTDGEAHRYYTWFTGFAPVHPEAGMTQVAVAVLVVNGPTWQVKANVVAREMLRAYFASKDIPGITRPSTTAIARHRH